MPAYPLMFTFRDAVSGNGFLAGITLSGRALIIPEEDQKWWIYGVRPGAIAEIGETPQEAYLRFRNTYKNLLFDIASESADYEAFKAEVERFYSQPDGEEELCWTLAVETLRSGSLVPEPPFESLPKEPPENRPSSIAVMRLDIAQRFTASDNVPDTYAVAAVA